MGHETGSVLLLVPAAVLVLVILGAVAVDAAVVFLGQRQLSDAAAAAATDAASAVSDSAFYGSGTIALDPATAKKVAASSVRAQGLEGVSLSGPVTVQVVGRQVCVSLVGQVSRPFGAAIPGIPARATVRARATATAAGLRGAAVPQRQIC